MPHLRELQLACSDTSLTLTLRNMPKLESLAPPYGFHVKNVELENVPLLSQQ